MDDSEYYAMMRRQYSHSAGISVKKKPSLQFCQNATSLQERNQIKTPGTFSDWSKKYGHEDAEMFEERNGESE